jgi:N-methylhydantoinase B/acetone carboxylase, alpha subunit
VPAGRRLVLMLPGGGGYGPASERSPEAIARDIACGYVAEA